MTGLFGRMYCLWWLVGQQFFAREHPLFLVGLHTTPNWGNECKVFVRKKQTQVIHLNRYQ